MTNDSKASVPAFFPWLILLAGMVATVFVYWPGLKGPLMFDDVSSIGENQSLKTETLTPASLQKAATSAEAGRMKGEPLTLLSHALDHYVAGDDVFFAKVVSLGLHLLNGLLVFLLLKMLSRFDSASSESLAASRVSAVMIALISVAWLLHPLNLTNVLYLVQRGTLLSTLFVLLAFTAYIKGRMLWKEESRGLSAAFFIGSAVAAIAADLSGEAFLLLPLALFFLEWLIPLGRPSTDRLGRSFTRLPVLFWLVVSVVFLGIFSQLHVFDTGFNTAQVPLSDVLLTEARVALYYLGLLVLPRPSELGLFHDDILWSSGLFSPMSTLFSIGGIIVLVVMAFLIRRKHALVTFGLLVFLATHFVGAWLMPGSIFEEYRNYLPSIGVLLAVTAGLMSSERLSLSAEIRFMVVLVFCIFFGAVTHGRALAWQSENRLSMTLLHNHPASPRANYEAASVYIDLSENPMIVAPDRDMFRQQAVERFLTVARLKPDDAGALLAVMLMDGLQQQKRKQAFLNDLLEGGSSTTIPLDIEEPLMREIPQRLSTGVPSSLELRNLVHVSRCERLEKCVFDPGVVDKLVSALLDNPHAVQNTPDMGALLDEAAVRALGQSKLITAKQLEERALSIEPGNPMFNLNWAVMLFTEGNREQALNQVRAVLAEPQAEGVDAYARQLLKSFDTYSAPEETTAP